MQEHDLIGTVTFLCSPTSELGREGAASGHVEIFQGSVDPQGRRPQSRHSGSTASPSQRSAVICKSLDEDSRGVLAEVAEMLRRLPAGAQEAALAWSFPNRDSLVRILATLLQEQDHEWQVADRCYSSDDPRPLLRGVNVPAHACGSR